MRSGKGGRDDSSDDESNPISKQPRQSATQKSSKTLLDLPPEILRDIFDFAREPSMIHACSYLHRLLPCYVQYTKSLLGLAFTSRDEIEDGPPNPLHAKRAKLWPLSGYERTEWTSEQLDMLQSEIAQSAWLQVHHLVEFHVICFRLMLGYMVLWNGNLEVESWSNDRKSDLETLWDTAKSRLGPEFFENARLKVGLSGKSQRMRIYDHLLLFDSWSDTQYWLFDVRCWPDCLSAHHPPEECGYIREVFLRSATRQCEIMIYDRRVLIGFDPDDRQFTHCNMDLLKARILETLGMPFAQDQTDDDRTRFEALYRWLAIQECCQWQARAPITMNMLKTCVRNNYWRYLRLLWGYGEFRNTLESSYGSLCGYMIGQLEELQVFASEMQPPVTACVEMITETLAEWRRLREEASKPTSLLDTQQVLRELERSNARRLAMAREEQDRGF